MQSLREFLWPSNDPFAQGFGLAVFMVSIIWLVAIATT